VQETCTKAYASFGEFRAGSNGRAECGLISLAKRIVSWIVSDPDTFLDVDENLLVPGFISDEQQAQAAQARFAGCLLGTWGGCSSRSGRCLAFSSHG
jgi:hypothetical protein